MQSMGTFIVHLMYYNNNMNIVDVSFEKWL